MGSWERLKPLADMVKTWKPQHLHEVDNGEESPPYFEACFESMNGEDCLCECRPCAGARKAIQDVQMFVGMAMIGVRFIDTPKPGTPKNAIDKARTDCQWEAQEAARIAFYFGHDEQARGFSKALVEELREVDEQERRGG